MLWRWRDSERGRGRRARSLGVEPMEGRVLLSAVPASEVARPRPIEIVFAARQARLEERAARLAALRAVRAQQPVDPNAGRTLTHVRVVRELRRIGRADQPSWSGDVDLDTRTARLRLIAFVQERSTGRVYDEPCHRIMGHHAKCPNTDWVARNHSCVPLYYRSQEQTL